MALTQPKTVEQSLLSFVLRGSRGVRESERENTQSNPPFFRLQPTRHSKLEKADILEMTVKHLQQIQRQQLSSAVATDPAVLTKFRSGFSECASEVSRYVNHLENVDPTVKQRLVSHLNNCVSNLQQVSPFYNHYVPYMPERLYPEVKVGFQAEAQSGDENNNGSGRIQIPSNVQLIPSRLPSGEFALLVPPSAGIGPNFPFFPPGAEAASRLGQPSAFTAVQRTHSPLLSPSTSTSSFEEGGHHSEHYPTSLSPPQSRFKMPTEQQPGKCIPSPDTQRPQISSSSDRSSPSGLEACPTPSRRELPEPSSRQPLSVITDKYNRSLGLTRREGGPLKRHHSSEGLLACAEKRPRMCQEAAPSVASTSGSGCASPGLRVKEEFAHSTEDLAEAPTSLVAGDSSTTGSGDMWRPW
jgi:hairy-and-enhancer-of-split protein